MGKLLPLDKTTCPDPVVSNINKPVSRPVFRIMGTEKNNCDAVGVNPALLFVKLLKVIGPPPPKPVIPSIVMVTWWPMRLALPVAVPPNAPVTPVVYTFS